MGLFFWFLIFICNFISSTLTLFSFLESKKFLFFSRTGQKTNLSWINFHCISSYILLMMLTFLHLLEVCISLQRISLVLQSGLHMSNNCRYIQKSVYKSQNLFPRLTLIATFLLQAGDKLYLNTFEIGPTRFTLQTKSIVRDALQSVTPVKSKISILNAL